MMLMMFKLMSACRFAGRIAALKMAATLMTSWPIFFLMLIFMSSLAAINLCQVGAQTNRLSRGPSYKTYIYNTAESTLHILTDTINEFDAPVQAGCRIPMDEAIPAIRC